MDLVLKEDEADFAHLLHLCQIAQQELIVVRYGCASVMYSVFIG